MKNLRIGNKLIVAFGSVIGVFVISILIGIISLNMVGDKLTQFYTGSYEVVTNCIDMRRSFQSAVKNILWASTTTDVEVTKTRLQNLDNDMGELKDGIEVLNAKFLGDKELVKQFESTMESSTQYKEQIMEYASQNLIDESLEVFNESYVPILLKAQEYLIEIGDDAAARAAQNYETANNTRLFSIILVFAISALSIGIAVAICIYITKSLVRPIKEIETAAVGLSQGKLDASITYESKDELGNLSKAMKVTFDALRYLIQDITFLFTEMADGNFNIDSSAKQYYIGEFEPILDAANKIIQDLSQALRTIGETSNQVSLGSQQMADSSQSLAVGATEQSSAIEELLATIHEVNEQVEKNAGNAQNASVKVVAVGNEAGESNEQMKHMTDAMLKISETSKQIELIIKTIEDIASQTNLLSLNAAIEAARAGDAGRGFAVVAEEIRELATQSAHAAVNTRNLISSSIAEVENGNQIVTLTSEALNKVVNNIDDIVGLIEQVKEDSSAQAESMEQINKGIEQISGVVESNSAAAEESSATSEELSAQATGLSELVGRFQVKTV